MDRSIARNVGFCALLSLLTLAVFRGVLGHDFLNYDDVQYVTGNERVSSGLSLANALWAFRSVYAANWHPITWLSHMLDVQLFGMNPYGHHLTNLLLHTANGCLLFLFLSKMTGAAWRSVLVAALFAVHPLHVESVAWVAERKDVLSTFFALATLLAYGYYLQKRGTWRYLALCGFFLLGLMSKPMLVTLPFVLLLLDYWPLQRCAFAPKEADRQANPAGGNLALSALLIEKLPLFALSAISCVVTIFAQIKGAAVHSLEVTPLSLRLANALLAYLRYLGKTIWPADLAVLYPLPGAISLLQSAASALALLLISYAVYRQARRYPYLPVGWLWFIGTLVPVIGIVQVGLQSMADRYSYFPLIGIFIALVWGGADLAAQRPAWRLPLILGSVAMLTACSALSRSYLRCWKNSNTLFSHAIAVTPDSYYAHYLLGKAFYEEHDFPDALSEYALVRRLNPRFAESYLNMGIIYAKQGNQAEAIGNFATALSLKPGSAEVHYNFAVALQSQGNLAGAIDHYREVLANDAENIGAHYNLGVALMGLKRWDEAMGEFSEILRLKPELEDARQNLQICLQQKAKN